MKKKQNKTKQQTNKTSYLLLHVWMEDTIRHNTSQMTSASKAYIP